MIGLGSSNDGDEHSIIERYKRVRLEVGVHQFARFIQANREEPMVTLLGGA